MTTTTYRAITIAKWFIAWADEAEAATVSNLKLQKLLYYAQGHRLGGADRPLFSDQIEAWSHGPVVPNVYHEFKRFGKSEIELPEEDNFRWSDVDPEATQFLMKVWNTYGGIAAWRLRNMTHDEAPWSDNFVDDARNLTIPVESMRRYFQPRTQVS